MNSLFSLPPIPTLKSFLTMKKAPPRQVLKARKNYAIGFSDLYLLTNRKPLINKRTVTSILKKQFRRQYQQNTITGEDQLQYYGGQLAKDIRKLKLNDQAFKTKKESKITKKTILAFKNLVSFSFVGTKSFLFFSYFKKVQQLNISLKYQDLFRYSKNFSMLTSLKKLKLGFRLLIPKEESSHQKFQLCFTRFWKDLALCKNLQDLELEFSLNIKKQDFPIFDILLDSLNQLTLANYHFAFSILQNQAINLEKLSNFLGQADLLTLRQKKGLNYLLIRPTSKCQREIFVDLEPGSLDGQKIIEEGKNLKQLYVYSDSFKPRFSNNCEILAKLKKVKIEFPFHLKSKINLPFQLNDNFLEDNSEELLESWICAFSQMLSLESLTFINFPLEEKLEKQVDRLYKLPCFKQLKKYKLNLQQCNNLSYSEKHFDLLTQVFQSNKQIESFKLIIKEIQKEEPLWNLLGLLPELKSLEIQLESCLEPMEFSGLFQNLSKMENLEKLHLMMLPGHRFDKKKMLQGLPKLKKLHNFIVRSKDVFPGVSFTEYKQFNKLE